MALNSEQGEIRIRVALQESRASARVIVGGIFARLMPVSPKPDIAEGGWKLPRPSIGQAGVITAILENGKAEEGKVVAFGDRRFEITDVNGIVATCSEIDG